MNEHLCLDKQCVYSDIYTREVIPDDIRKSTRKTRKPDRYGISSDELKLGEEDSMI